MRYAEAARFLYGLAPRGVSLGLGRVERALALRGHPERACPAIIVAGTNGKGSVASMIAAVLKASGQRVGLYTSPHLHRLTERFRIDGKPVAQGTFADHVTSLAPFLRDPATPPLTFFEACTLLAFELFRDARCDVMVLEVGLGGRLDATNVVTPLVSVVTRIAFDHADRLGPTLAHIAREKAGVVKPGVPAVSGVRTPEAARVMRARARRVGAELAELSREVTVAEREGVFDVHVGPRAYPNLSITLQGEYQRDNLACAVAALDVVRERFSVTPRTLARGLRAVRWPGRLELVRGRPDVLFDAAHNPDACEALARELARLAPSYGRTVLLFGVLRDKDHAAMLALLRPHVDALVVATPDTPRALPAKELLGRRKGDAIDDPLKAFAVAKKRAGPGGLVVAAGSIFLMAAVRAHELGLGADPPIAM